MITGNDKDHSSIHVPGVDPDNAFMIASTINEHFVSVTSDMDCVDLSSLPAYLPSSQPCPYLYPWEVYKSLQTIKLSTAGGPDNITAWFINHFAVELATSLLIF